jgi:hypothetical protein
LETELNLDPDSELITDPDPNSQIISDSSGSGCTTMILIIPPGNLEKNYPQCTTVYILAEVDQ